MKPHILNDDDALMELLGEAMAEIRHAKNEALLDGARAAFSFRTMDQELAALVYDSSLEPESVGAGRAPDAPRTVVFETEDVSVEIEIHDGGMIGQVVPPGQGTVTAEGPDGRRTQVETDELGCFTLNTPGRGPVRLHITTGDAAAVTEWTDLDPPA
jgi:hypothetical protein